MFKPLHKAGSLLLGNPASPVGIVTLWTVKAKVAASLDPDQYAAVGQLYSPTQGLDYLVRNLLANPSLRYLVLTGQDLSGSGAALRAFFEEGVEEGRTSLGAACWRVRSRVESFVERDLPGEALEELRANVRLVVCPERDELPDLVRRLAAEPAPPPYSAPRLFPRPELDAGTVAAERAVHVVRGETVAEAWVQVLHRIWTFGQIGRTRYESRQKELLDLVTVVSVEDPDQPHLPDYLPCTRERLAAYYPTVLSAASPAVPALGQGDIRYTYGHRLRAHFGVDQVEQVVADLGRDRSTRSAVASLWDPAADGGREGAPCLNHLWFRAAGGALTLTAVLRSNDMFKAWPENALALRRLQEIVRAGVVVRGGEPLALGDLVVVSESAHVYEEDWGAIEHVLARQYAELAARLRERRDPRGNFLVELEPDTVRVERIAPTGEHIRYYRGKSAGALARQLDHDAAVSSVEHALYLGAELQKAELALRYPDVFRYVQDQPLERLSAGRT